MKNKPTYKEVKQILKQNKCILLQQDYRNKTTAMNYICECGSQSSITLKKFITGQRCNNCAKSKRANSKRMFDIKQVKEIFLSSGYTLLANEYLNCNQSLKYKCDKGHIGNTSLSNFKNGHRCKKCSGLCGSANPRWNPNREQVRLNEMFRKRCYNILSRCLYATGQTKHCKTEITLGYTTKELQDHISSHPNWDLVKDKNWHLDHVFPIKAFIDYGINDIKLINCLQNLRPCESGINLFKHCKYDKNEFEMWLKENIF